MCTCLRGASGSRISGYQLRTLRSHRPKFCKAHQQLCFLHLLVTGTLGVLAEAHRAGLLNFEAALARLRQTNFYLSAELVDRVRKRLSTGGETYDRWAVA